MRFFPYFFFPENKRNKYDRITGDYVVTCACCTYIYILLYDSIFFIFPRVFAQNVILCTLYTAFVPLYLYTLRGRTERYYIVIRVMTPCEKKKEKKDNSNRYRGWTK